jgi:hypothetical protein
MIIDGATPMGTIDDRQTILSLEKKVEILGKSKESQVRKNQMAKLNHQKEVEKLKKSNEEYHKKLQEKEKELKLVHIKLREFL